MRKLFMLASVLFALTAFPQDKKKGFLFGVRMGRGSANGLCLSCGEKGSIPGYTFSAEVGYRFNQHFALTIGPYDWIEGKGMFEDDTYSSCSHNSRLHLLAFASYYPFVKADAYLKTGLGAGNYFFTPRRRMLVDSGDSTYSSLVNTGFAWTAGIGYQIRISSGLVVKPELNFLHTAIGTLKATTGETIHNEKPSVVKEFSIGIFVAPRSHPK